MRGAGTLVLLALLGLVAACSSTPSTQSTALPGDIDAHVAEASRRFDIPEVWIREVIRQESGGRTTLNGKPIVSKAGAMGLMQLMPGTYAEMRRKHGLGSDPFHPRDNILAGTAYIREMYNLFGAPGFLAAYNCGPGCYADYLAGNRSLPGETKRYLAAVAPRLNATPGPNGSDIVVASSPPTTPSARIQPPTVVDVVAPESSPVLPSAPLAVAAAEPAPVERQPSVERTPIQQAALPAPPVRTNPPAPAAAAAPVRVAAAGQWTVQIGAFKSPDDSGRAIDRARSMVPSQLGRSQRVVQPIASPFGPLYRARLAGLSQEAASSACANLVNQGMACFVVAPGA